jgi:hypothetical protein
MTSSREGFHSGTLAAAGVHSSAQYGTGSGEGGQSLGSHAPDAEK